MRHVVLLLTVIASQHGLQNHPHVAGFRLHAKKRATTGVNSNELIRKAGGNSSDTTVDDSSFSQVAGTASMRKSKADRPAAQAAQAAAAVLRRVTACVFFCCDPPCDLRPGNHTEVTQVLLEVEAPETWTPEPICARWCSGNPVNIGQIERLSDNRATIEARLKENHSIGQHDTITLFDGAKELDGSLKDAGPEVTVVVQKGFPFKGGDIVEINMLGGWMRGTIAYVFQDSDQKPEGTAIVTVGDNPFVAMSHYIEPVDQPDLLRLLPVASSSASEEDLADPFT